MAPNDMSNDQRLDEHGNRLNAHDERLNIHAQRFDKMELSLYGDDRSKIKGLVQSVDDLSKAINGLVDWRDQLVTYAKGAVWGARLVMLILVIIAGGVWLPLLEKVPQLQDLLRFLGG